MQPCSDGFIMTHSYGFFSNCSVLLEYILTYYNKNKCLPTTVDVSKSWSWYRPSNRHQDAIFYDYFKPVPSIPLPYIEDVFFSNDDQYLNMKDLPHKQLRRFIDYFFTPTDEIWSLVHEIEAKYGLTNIYSDLCCLFYRGNDKIQETSLPPYEALLERARAYKEKNPSTRFIIQSDETEFIDAMQIEFPDSIVFHEYIRHIPKSNTSVDKLNTELNYQYSKYFLAIVLIMSKCSHIVCISGNISMWISFFRGSADGLEQFKTNTWV
jgi:hypothetical protein